MAKGNIDHRPETKLAFQGPAPSNHAQPKGRSIGTSHKRSPVLAQHGGSSHRVGSGKSPLIGGKGIFGK